MVRNAELAITPPRSPKLFNIPQQPLLLTRLQDDRLQKARRVGFYARPEFVVGEQKRLYDQLLFVAGNNVVHEFLKEALLPPNRGEVEGFRPLRCPAASVFTPVESNTKRPAPVPKPMQSRSRNQGTIVASERGVQIHPTQALEEFLFQKPFLDPNEGRVIIFDGNHHRRLLNEPRPELFWHSPQIDADAAHNHEQQSARRELILTGQYALQKSESAHCDSFLTGIRRRLVSALVGRLR